MTQHIQKNPHKAISGFLCKNLAYQEKVGGNIQSYKIKNPTKNTKIRKSVLQKWGRDKDIPKHKLREFIRTRLGFQEMLKKVLQVKMKGH